MRLTYRELLEDELKRRRSVNPAYSLRAFARDLKMTAPQLSDVLSGKKGISATRAHTVCQALQLSDEETKRFLASVTALHARSERERKAASLQVAKLDVRSDFAVVQEARFQLIAEWYHLAILHLSETVGFSWDAAKIGQRLGLSSAEVTRALKTLEKASLLKKTKHGYEPTDAFLRTDDIPSRAIRMNHRQMLSKAMHALEQQPHHERDFSTVLVAVDPRRVPEFKERLKKFREEFCLEAGAAGPKNQVYALGLQLFRVSQF